MLELCFITTLSTLYFNEGLTEGQSANLASQLAPTMVRMVHEHGPELVLKVALDADPTRDSFTTYAFEGCLED